MSGADGGGDRLDALLADAHRQVGIAVYDSLMSQGGPPEPCDPDLALSRLLAAAHRRTLAAVVRRADRVREEVRVRRGPSAGCGSVLMRHPAAVRLKYREETLRMARAYWPRELEVTVRRALEAVLELVARLEEGRVPEESGAVPARVAAALGDVLSLPQAPPRPPALTGYDYPEVARARLAARAGRLMDAARGARGLLEAELLPRLGDGPVPWTGALEVARDLADDLEAAGQSAQSLLAAVVETEEAGDDFRGADLSAVALEGVRLEGIRWDAGTVWPPGWERRIWRVSLATGDGPGVLVVGPEPHDSAVAADI
ncbi:hypothetical protein [Streptomyces sp. NPDC001985]|uniref:hypothetical protein n=1 Tax=Streptomyces sp. NPDC001985 TaxID=3154406 RepID=UPI00332732E7